MAKKKIDPHKDLNPQTREWIDTKTKQKGEFERIRKEDYSKALKYWEDNLEWECNVYDLRPGDSFPWGATEDERFTNTPKNQDEGVIFNKWYLGHYTKMYFDLAKGKAQFHETLQKSNNPEKFITSEIAKLNANRRYLAGNKFKMTSDADSIKTMYDLEGRVPEWHKVGINEVKEFSHAKYEVDMRVYIESVEKKNRETGPIKPQLKKLDWNNKTELCELIFALSKSERIRMDGAAIMQKDLIELFEKIFTVDLKNFHDLLGKAKVTNKRSFDDKLFTAELLEYVQKYHQKG